MLVKPGTARPHVLEPLPASAVHTSQPENAVEVAPAASRAHACIRNFCCALPRSSPQFLEAFRTRNSEFSASKLSLLVAWSGEYPGKWLTHCTELWRLTADVELGVTIQAVVDTLAECQAADGYLAPWADGERWSTAHWDSWGHYHCMLGCLLWAEASGDPTAAAVAAGVGAVVCAAFPTAQKLYAQVRKHTMRSDFSGPRFGRLSGKCQSFVGGSFRKLQMHRT